MNARPRKEIDLTTYTGRFAARLKMLREKKKMTVKELAEASGIPKRTIYAWESTENQPLIGQLPQLAEALGVKIRTILPEE